MINASIFNEQQQANEISSGTSNSTQRCPTINNKVQKQMEVLWTLNMQVLVLQTFFFLSFFLFFSFLLNK
jgi:quinol-cytochrome oxidoreductase complex cytochrome b subunit